MNNWLSWLRCRLFHRDCAVKHRTSKSLLKEMEHEGRRVEVTTYELRKQREDIAGTIGGHHRG